MLDFVCLSSNSELDFLSARRITAGTSEFDASSSDFVASNWPSGCSQMVTSEFGASKFSNSMPSSGINCCPNSNSELEKNVCALVHIKYEHKINIHQ